jgi:hypothetical protein
MMAKVAGLFGYIAAEGVVDFDDIKLYLPKPDAIA